MAKDGAREYEAVFIFEVGEEKIGSVKKFVVDELKGADIRILKEDDLGERSLAYEVNKQNRGHYFRYELEADPNTIKTLENPFKLRSEILKFMYFRKNS